MGNQNKKKTKRAADRKHFRKTATSKPNPFEEKSFSKSKKHTVIGRSNDFTSTTTNQRPRSSQRGGKGGAPFKKGLGVPFKKGPGVQGRPQGRSVALKKRQTTLLREYQGRNKNNMIVDRRILERDEKVDNQDKMTKRFAQERKKAFKSDKYNLEDGGIETSLTHFGQSLADVEKYDDPRSDSDDEEDERALLSRAGRGGDKLGGDYVGEAHFGGFMTKVSDEKAKSREEHIADLIEQSKLRKRDKQMAKDENFELTEKLDDQWKALCSKFGSTLKREPKTKPLIESKPSEIDYDQTYCLLKFPQALAPNPSAPEHEPKAPEPKIPLPEDTDELESLLKDKTMRESEEIIGKMLKSNHISLLEENKVKLEGFLSVLIDFIDNHCAGEVEVVEVMLPHLHGLCKQFPKTAASQVLAFLLAKHDVFMSRNARRLEKRERTALWPDLNTLVFVKLVPTLFDLSHAGNSGIANTNLLLIGQIVSGCRLKTVEDFVEFVLYAGVAWEMVKASKVLVPEVVTRLQDAVKQAELCSGEGEVSDNAMRCFRSMGFAGDRIAEDAQLGCVRLLGNFFKIYESLPSVPQLFQTVADLKDFKFASSKVMDEFEELQTAVLATKNRGTLKPLSRSLLDRRPPIMLKMYEPRFDMKYDGRKKGMKQGGTKSFQDKRKLKHQHKREFKGAVREVRRDNKFLAKVRLDEHRQKDDERRQKLKRLYADLQIQEGGHKQMERQKKRRR